MNRILNLRYVLFRTVMVIALFCGIGGVKATAQTLLDNDASTAVIDSISNRWEPWDHLSISGKLKMAGLPVSPSVRLYMERDSVIMISLRAPFVGEVGRAEIADSTVVMVNKMNKTYVEAPLAKLLSYYPGGISDIQSLLLGRAVMPGSGQITAGMAEDVEIYVEEDGRTTIIPSDDTRIDGFDYGYSFTPDFLLEALMVLPLSNPDTAVSMQYTYYEKGYDIEFLYQSEKKNYRALLELDYPDPDGKGFDRIKLGGKYTQVSFDKFLKSF